MTISMKDEIQDLRNTVNEQKEKIIFLENIFMRITDSILDLKKRTVGKDVELKGEHS